MLKGHIGMTTWKDKKTNEQKQKRRRRISQILKINLDILIEKAKKNNSFKEEEKVYIVRNNRVEAKQVATNNLVKKSEDDR